MNKEKKVYFLAGIGGMGMLPLALYLKEMGHCVVGYDDALGEEVEFFLKEADIECQCVPSLPERVTDFIYSAAISNNHPLYIEAKQRSLPMKRRGECWADCVAKEKLVAIVGSHGKTTTTAMAVSILRQSGYFCGYYVGGLMRNRLPSGHYDPSGWVVSEIDESDGTIELFSPMITVGVNFDWDHSDRYVSKQALEETFGRLFARTQGCILVPSSDKKLLKIAKQYATVPVIIVGEEPRMIEPIDNGIFSVKSDRACSQVSGYFNALNASMAMSLVQAMGVELTDDPLKMYRGVLRRQDWLYVSPSLKVLGDYAHHPTELEAIIGHVQSMHVNGEFLVVFQPHRYTRTRQYKDDFARVLSRADRIVLLGVYAASEPFLADGTVEAIIEAMDSVTRSKTVLIDKNNLVDYLKSMGVKKGVIAFLGAGDIEKYAKIYVDDLEKIELL